MPSCNRRNPHAFLHHLDADFPSPMEFAAALDAALQPAFEQYCNSKSSSSSGSNATASNNNENSSPFYIFRMDVPGVKADRISIEESNGEVEITAVRMKKNNSDQQEDGEEIAKIYQEVFYVNPFRFVLEDTKATLTNGVLTLKIPKNQESSKLLLDVESTGVPTNLPDNIFRHTLDLPGVAASSLEVKLIEDQVHLTGTRSMGSDKRIRVQRSFEVPPSMDTLQARALLQDGVFTFLAPIHEKDHSLRTIVVEEAMEVEEDGEATQDDAPAAASVAGLKIADDEMNSATPNQKLSTGEDETMNVDETNVQVETVDEAVEDKDSWEEVRSEENH